MDAIDLTRQPSEDSMDVMIADDMVVHQEADLEGDGLSLQAQSSPSLDEEEDLSSCASSVDDEQLSDDDVHFDSAETAKGVDVEESYVDVDDELGADDADSKEMVEEGHVLDLEKDVKQEAQEEENVDSVHGDADEQIDGRALGTETSEVAVGSDMIPLPLLNGVENADDINIGSSKQSELAHNDRVLDFGVAEERKQADLVTESPVMVSARATPSPPPPPPSFETKVIKNHKDSMNDHIVRANGLEFNTAEPWQRSLLRELERKRLEEKPTTTSRRKPFHHPIKHGQMLVGHTESRDFAIEMCESGTFSIMSESSSVAPPSHPQMVHRSRAYRDEDIFVHEPQGRYRDGHGRDRVASRGQGSPRSIYDELRQATRYTGHSPYTDKWLEIEQFHMDDEGKQYPDYNDDATAVTYGTAEGQQEACYCLGYNIMDLILPPPQRSHKSRGMRSRRRLQVPQSRLAHVREDPDEHDYSSNSKESSPRHRYRREYTPESRLAPENSYRNRPIRQTQSRDPDGAYLDHY